MQETPCAAALQGFLRYLHPSRAGRRRVASVEKHLCACGAALWTHIRSLVCKSKVGLRVGRDFWVGGARQGPCRPVSGSVPLPVPLLVGWGWAVCASLCPGKRRGERGLVITVLWKGRKGIFLLPCFPVYNCQMWWETVPFLGSRKNRACPLPSWAARTRELGVRDQQCASFPPATPGLVESWELHWPQSCEGPGVTPRTHPPPEEV